MAALWRRLGAWRLWRLVAALWRRLVAALLRLVFALWRLVAALLRLWLPCGAFWRLVSVTALWRLVAARNDPARQQIDMICRIFGTLPELIAGRCRNIASMIAGIIAVRR